MYRFYSMVVMCCVLSCVVCSSNTDVFRNDAKSSLTVTSHLYRLGHLLKRDVYYWKTQNVERTLRRHKRENLGDPATSFSHKTSSPNPQPLEDLTTTHGVTPGSNTQTTGWEDTEPTPKTPGSDDFNHLGDQPIGDEYNAFGEQPPMISNLNDESKEGDIALSSDNENLDQLSNSDSKLATNMTCEGHCGNGYDMGCDCDIHCFVYKTCCPDVDAMCPGTRFVAEATFGPVLMGNESKGICVDNSGKIMVIGCEEENISNGDISQPLNISEPSIYDYFLQFIPVYDSHINILYKNWNSFQCFRDSKSIPIFWQLSLGAYSLVGEKGNISDLRRSLENKEYTLMPPDGDFYEKNCTGNDFFYSNYPFSILVNMAPSSRMDVVFLDGYDSTQLNWYCLDGQLNSCNGNECGGFNTQVSYCPRLWTIQIQISHPHWMLSLGDIYDMGRVIECNTENSIYMPKAILDSVRYDVEKPKDIFDGSPSDRYFELTFNITHNLDNGFLSLVFADTVAYALQCLGLATVMQGSVMEHSHLQFIPDGDNATKRQVKMFPGMLKDSSKCSVVGQKYMMNDTDNMISEKSLHVAGCVMITKGLLDQDNYWNPDHFCFESLMKPGLPEFQQCITEDYHTVVGLRELTGLNESITSKAPSRGNVAACKIIFFIMALRNFLKLSSHWTKL